MGVLVKFNFTDPSSNDSGDNLYPVTSSDVHCIIPLRRLVKQLRFEITLFVLFVCLFVNAPFVFTVFQLLCFHSNDCKVKSKNRCNFQWGSRLHVLS